jgi:signal transduction histidine kinase
VRTLVRLPLLGAVLLLLAAALVAGLVPGGLDLDRRVTQEIRSVAVEDLGRAPMILDDRNAAQAEALSMHAMSVAGTEGLREAVEAGRLEQAAELARATAGMYGEDPVLISLDGHSVVGPTPGPDAMAGLRKGEGRLDFVFYEGMPRAVGLVALGSEFDWAGAAGSASEFGPSLASTLAGLARADVTILGPTGGLVTTTLDSATATALTRSIAAGQGRKEGEKVEEVSIESGEYWVAIGALDEAGSVVFSRSVAEELAALPGVRRSYALAGLFIIVLAIVVGAVVATLLTRPVQALATAADRVSDGDFDAPVPDSRVEELHRLGTAFRTMRDTLRTRLAELAAANQELGEKQQRLTTLQAELIRQDRLSSSARMVAELAHEIRNPVANVRNCLEVVRRGLPEDGEGVRFADMAIDELLRMHELAENLLDLNRPSDPALADCDPMAVARQVVALVRVGEEAPAIELRGADVDGLCVAMPPDALKQVLFNLVENALEASGSGSTIEIEVVRRDGSVRLDVLDAGPGISDSDLPHLFDPFFTTKGAMHGVGLGLFVAEGLVRRYGGRVEASNREERGGARLRIEVPLRREAHG